MLVVVTVLFFVLYELLWSAALLSNEGVLKSREDPLGLFLVTVLLFQKVQQLRWHCVQRK